MLTLMGLGRHPAWQPIGPQAAGPIWARVARAARPAAVAHAPFPPPPPARRPEDVRHMFEKFGEVKDVYLPRDYYTQ